MSKYKVIEELGRGGMGIVYRAHQTSLGRDVAMKVLSQDSLQKPLRRARFEREIEACIRLRHPSIIEIYDYGEHRGQPFYAMELMDAPSMMALVHREGPLSAARILSTLLQIGDALRSCHERGLIHRDVKPHNIVMKESGQAILMDFGLTKVFKKGSLTAPGALIGTPRFLAPEIILGRGASPATDVYALGASLYELATGLPAHPEDRSFDLLLGSILEDPPPSIRDVRPEFPEDVDALIRCMLDKDSAARIPLQSAWRRARSLLKRLHPPTFVSVDGLLNPLARDGLISADSVDGLTSAARAWIDGDGPTPLPADGAGFPNLSLEAVHEGSAPAEKHPSRPPRPTRNTVLIASIGVVLSILLCLWYGSGGAPERAFPPDADRPQAQAFSTKISSAPPPGRTGTGSTPQSADRRRVVTFIKRQIFAGDDYVTVSLESTEAIGLRIELIDAETRKSVHRDESSGPVERIWRMIPGKGRLEQNHNYLLVVEPTEAGVEFIPGVFRVRTQGRRYRAQVQEGFTSFGVTSVSDAFAAGRLHSQRDARTVDKVLDLLLSKDVQRGIESSTFLLLVGTVGRVGDPRSVPRLIRLLDRPRTPQECVTIIEALGEIGDPVATGSVLKAILELARTDHLVSAERLALGLSKLDSRAVSEYARGVIHGGGTHSLAERLMVAMALGNGGRSEFASLLTDLALTDPESSVRRLATSNLLFLPRNSASASYRMLLSPRRPGSGDVDSQVEESALLGLGLTGGALDGPSLVPRLAPDQPRRVRRAAVAALGYSTPPDGLKALLGAIVQFESEDLPVLLWAIGQYEIRGREASGLLGGLVGRDLPTGGMLAVALHRIGGESASGFLRILASRQGDLPRLERVHALWMLGERGDAPDQDLLTGCLGLAKTPYEMSMILAGLDPGREDATLQRILGDGQVPILVRLAAARSLSHGQDLASILALKKRATGLPGGRAFRERVTEILTTLSVSQVAELPGPDSSGPDSSGPDSSGPDSSGPDSSGPDSSGPDSSGPDSSGPDSSGSPTRSGRSDRTHTILYLPGFLPALGTSILARSGETIRLSCSGAWLASDGTDSISDGLGHPPLVGFAGCRAMELMTRAGSEQPIGLRAGLTREVSGAGGTVMLMVNHLLLEGENPTLGVRPEAGGLLKVAIEVLGDRPL